MQVRAQAAAVSTATKVVVKEHGSVSLRGTVRKVNEDRLDVKVRGRGQCCCSSALLFSCCARFSRPQRDERCI